MRKILLLYGASTALIIVVIRFMELSHLSGTIPLQAYIALIGLAFLAIGWFIARKLVNPSVVIRYIEKEPAPVRANEQANADLLSKRELEVLEQMAMGLTNQEIANKLFVSLNTVKTHTNNIYSKLEVRRRTQAVQRAKELNIIP